MHGKQRGKTSNQGDTNSNTLTDLVALLDKQGHEILERRQLDRAGLEAPEICAGLIALSALLLRPAGCLATAEGTRICPRGVVGVEHCPRACA